MFDSHVNVIDSVIDSHVNVIDSHVSPQDQNEANSHRKGT